MKVGVIIQARMGSTRLPGKVMHDLVGQTVLKHVVDRVRQAKQVDQIIIATTLNRRDDVIEQEMSTCHIDTFRGSEDNVLSRYYHAAKQYALDIVVRITSDCPLIDPKVLEDMLTFFKNNTFKIVSNAGADLTNRTYPRGLDIEIFSFDTLQKAFLEADKMYHKEHVTPYIYEHIAPVHYYKNKIDYSKYRWTLDTEEDFKLISKVYQHLYKGQHDFYMAEIVRLFEAHPQLYEINAHIDQKTYTKA